jgi:DNA-binding NarL/FixJ family response regulator
MYAEMIAEGLQRDGNLLVVASVTSSCAFLELAAHHTVDVVIINCTQLENSMDGISTLREFHNAQPHTPAIALLDSSRREDVLAAFRSGARGIFNKRESLENLCKCVRVVYDGQVWANRQQLHFVLEALASAASIRAVNASGMNMLSKREHAVATYVAQGLTNREIAVKLGLSPHTIKNYLVRIFDKVGVSNRVELLRCTLGRASPFLSVPAGTG